MSDRNRLKFKFPFFGEGEAEGESPPSSSWWFSLSPSRCTISKKEPCRDCGRLRVQGASPHAAACVRLRPCQRRP
jgi:hypothetical protein